MKKPVWILILCGVLTTSACSTVNSQAPGENEYVLAEQLIGELFETYKSFNRPDFSLLLAEDFTPGAGEFLTRAEANYHAARVLDMNYFLEKVNLSPEALQVSFKWEKATIPQGAKEISLSEGSVSFVFHPKEDEWLLFKISGDSPF